MKYLSNLIILTVMLALSGCGDDKPDGVVERYASYCDAEYTVGGKYSLDCTLNGAAVTATDAAVVFDASTTELDENGNPIYSRAVVTLKNIVDGQKAVTVNDVPIVKTNGGYSFKFTTTSGGTAIDGNGTVQASYSSGTMTIVANTK